jgi:ribosome-binding factor A
MSKEYSRSLRIGEQIQRELAVLIRQEVKDPRLGMVTVSAVKMSPDLSHAKVYVTVLGGEQSAAGETLKALNRAASFLRHELSRRMILRIMPQLHFVYDESQEKGARLVSLIDASVAADKKKSGQT